MKKIAIYISVVFLTIGTAASAQSNWNAQPRALQEVVEEIVSNEALSEAVVSICARTGSGEPLVDINACRMVMPASNVKLVTTGAAMHLLGSGYRFETKIGYSGEIRGGTLYGDLYIIGGGDPTLGSKDSIAVAIEKTFGEWKAMLDKAGIGRIEGCIIGDGRHFDGMPEHPTWLWSDVGTYYGAGATGLIFYENMQSFSVSAGAKAGAPVNIAPSYPDTPWMEFIYSCRTGVKGTGDQLYMYTSDLAPIAEIRGTFGIDRKPKRVDCSNKFPEYTCAVYFTDYLNSKGIRCSGGASDFRLHRNTSPSDSLTVIGSTLSPTLRRIAFETNHASNNLYAETLYRTLGKAKTGKACYDSCGVALNKILKEMGISTKGLSMVDGSGLSRQNYVSADFFCRFLESMMSSSCFEDYIEGIPSPGYNGTLSYNMSKYPAEMRTRIKAKSGSMGGVRCYSGYVIPTEGCKDDTVIFSIMVNNCTAPTWKLRPLLDKIMAAFAAAN